MGWWGTGHGSDVIGDEPADTLTAAFEDLAADFADLTLPGFLDALAAALRDNAGHWWDGSAADVTTLTAVVDPGHRRMPAAGQTLDVSLVEDLSDTFDAVADDYLDALDRLPRLHELLSLVAFVLGDRPDLCLRGLSPEDSVLDVSVA